MATGQLLAVLKREAPRFFESSMVVGNWVWVAFEQRQPRRVTALLSQLGFHWAKRRQAWQHPCGHFVNGPSRVDPRETYGVRYPSQFRNA